MTSPTVSSTPRAAHPEQLRRLHGAYALGVAAWTLSLLISLLNHDANVRQVVVLLGLLAAFALLWLWSAWQLWTGRHNTGSRQDS
ncbi:hypothetical protein ACIHAA_30725 [Streptomyces sp. NPDC052040]|uniref:hypothetical protein n=1 Tax=unclassified Streptomyces TaxID=2593676 RepID=UPI0037D49963